MSGSTRGRLLRLGTWGESHGEALGAILDGCPPGVPVEVEAIQAELDRRRPGRGRLTSARREGDRVRIRAGVAEGYTTGAPIALEIPNEDVRSRPYREQAGIYRPGHADRAWAAKYGRALDAGGGRASGRETASWVAAGAVAKRILAHGPGAAPFGWVARIGEVVARGEPSAVQPEAILATEGIPCPDPEAAARMARHVDETRRAGESLGGVVACAVHGVPAGLGEPVFDKLDARLGAAVLAIPATKGVEIGSGFEAAAMRGSAHNDALVPDGHGGVVAETNHAGGIEGGVSNGMPVLLRVAFKPVPSHGRPQRTVDRQGRPTELRVKGRHDPCVVPRAVPVVEAVVALELADAWLCHRSRTALR